MIIFETVKWKNLLSYGNTWTEIKLNKSKSTLIVGENGCGKSSMIEAICYALYGKPFRKIKKGQLINSINGGSAECVINFSIGSSKYRIEREIKKHGSNKFEIYKNDVLIDQNACSKEYQSFLEENILKLNYKSFTQIVILGSATFTPFMQLSTANRRQIIEDILDIQVFTTMNTMLKERISENKDLVNKTSYKIDSVGDKIDMQMKHIAALKKNNDERITQLKLKIEGYQEEIKSETLEVERMNSEVSELQQQITDKDVLAKKRKKLEQLEYKIEAKMASIKKEIHFYCENDSCPTCLQVIDSTFKEDKVNNKKTVLVETEKGVTALKDEYDKITKRMEQISTVQTKITSLLSDISSKNSTISSLKRIEESTVKEIESLRKEQSSEIQEKQELLTLQKEQAGLNTTYAEALEEKSALEVSQMILKDTGIKSRIISQYIPIINKLIGKYLSLMDFFVQFELNENFEETIRSRYRDEFSYSSFSEGEKMKIDLALMMTWRAVSKLRNSVSTNLLIMDEVFDSSLDANGTEEFIKILNEMADGHVFVISHRGDQLADKFHSQIRFVKNKNFSQIASN